MFPELFLPLVKYFSGFNIFQYITFRSAYAAMTALLVSFVFGRPLIRKLQRLKAGQEVREDGPETHLVKSGTPTMGGLLILISVTIATLLWQDLNNPYTWLLLFSMIAFGGIGFVDDYLKIFRKSSDGMHARVKFIGQTVVALIIVVLLYIYGNEHTTLLYIPFSSMRSLICPIFTFPLELCCWWVLPMQ